MTTEPPTDGADTPKAGEGINPSVRRGVDAEFTEDQHGSEPMESVSVEQGQTEVWPIIWAIVAIGLVLITIWLIF